MPELPDVTVYIERLEALVVGQPLTELKLRSPFVLRTVDPPYRELQGKVVCTVHRMGKRIVFGFDDALYAVVHLMIAGRFRWRKVGFKGAGKDVLATFAFPNGVLVFTEASKKKRASLHVVRGEAALAPFDRGGLEVLEAPLPEFAARLRAENHTLKRSLTDPRLFSGIGNAYSDEILFHARLSPVKWTSRLTDEEIERLWRATVATLGDWIARTRDEVGDGFPEKVTAFRPDMAVHGRYREPCVVCGSKVQRIVYADNETNYCATCQTEGKLLRDRALSQLLKGDWPKTLTELEERLDAG